MCIRGGGRVYRSILTVTNPIANLSAWRGRFLRLRLRRRLPRRGRSAHARRAAAPAADRRRRQCGAAASAARADHARDDARARGACRRCCDRGCSIERGATEPAVGRRQRRRRHERARDRSNYPRRTSGAGCLALGIAASFFSASSCMKDTTGAPMPRFHCGSHHGESSPTATEIVGVDPTYDEDR